MTPDAYCKDKAARSGSSFLLSFHFLSPERRRAMTALYAFCREVDDVVDECTDPQLARVKLGWWRAEVDRLYAGTPQHPVTRALQHAVARFELPQALLKEIILGMEMDLDQARYATFPDLLVYCYRVASTVGLLAARIFGYQDPVTLRYAHDLGIAFQLTNIIRDVGEDALRGRIYLPREEIARFGLADEAIQTRTAAGTPAFAALMGYQVDRAKEWYAKALAALPAIDRKRQRPGLIMAAIYRALLEEIQTDGCRVLSHRVSLPGPRKVWIACKAGFSASQ